MNSTQIRKALQRALAVLEMIAKLTPTPYDDMAVELLQVILGDKANVDKVREMQLRSQPK